jgi:MFS family permease
MSFQPADTLKNRTFVGLIIAQFLAGFNDQAIHAAAMFYAIHRGLLTEAQAISLMPILFYAPWAIFCTTSAFLADRFSKTTSIVVWKFSEIIISILLTLGFYLGTVHHLDVGIWLVLSCVFCMGAHAAFFSPAKYGAMPEVLQSHVLSRGNGVLESSTFLANILGTVSGGLLSFALSNQEYYIGLILLVLSVIGAVASLMMAKLPASDPTKKYDFIKPLTHGFRDVFTSRPLALSVMGIAFFIFMVSYMRSTMYMHGQTRVPPWDDFHTSLVVASVALGVGLGSPLAGWMSGGKIELGLVPIGCLGMIVSCVVAAFLLNHEFALIGALVGIGFFSGYYMVPLYSLLQHRAPKKSKGEIVAVSNFVNVTGAMMASALFFVLVEAGKMTGITPLVEQEDNVLVGAVLGVEKDQYQHVTSIKIHNSDGREVTLSAERTIALLTLPENLKKGDAVIVSEYFVRDAHHFVIRRQGEPLAIAKRQGKEIEQNDEIHKGTIDEIRRNEQGHVEAVTLTTAAGEAVTLTDEKRVFLLKLPGQGVKTEDRVIVSRYTIHNVVYNTVRPANETMKAAFNNEALPKYLFFGAGAMTLAILLLLRWKLPDFFIRTLFWCRSFGRHQLKAVGMDRLPTSGPVILASNCADLQSALQMISATDRHVVMVLAEKPGNSFAAPLLRRLVRGLSVVKVEPGGDWSPSRPRAQKALKAGELLGVTIDGGIDDARADAFLGSLGDISAPVLPVWCGAIQPGKVRVVFGEPAKPKATVAELRGEIERLKEWVHANDGNVAAGH